jgi:hypothetical protein
MWADTDVSEEWAVSIFRIDFSVLRLYIYHQFRIGVCMFRIKLSCIGKVQEGLSWDPRRGDEQGEWSRKVGRNWSSPFFCSWHFLLMVAVKRSVFVQLFNTVPLFLLKTTWEPWKPPFFSFHFPSVTINQCAPNKESFWPRVFTLFPWASSPHSL